MVGNTSHLLFLGFSEEIFEGTRASIDGKTITLQPSENLQFLDDIIKSIRKTFENSTDLSNASKVSLSQIESGFLKRNSMKRSFKNTTKTSNSTWREVSVSENKTAIFPTKSSALPVNITKTNNSTNSLPKVGSLHINASSFRNRNKDIASNVTANENDKEWISSLQSNIATNNSILQAMKNFQELGDVIVNDLVNQSDEKTINKNDETPEKVGEEWEITVIDNDDRIVNSTKFNYQESSGDKAQQEDSKKKNNSRKDDSMTNLNDAVTERSAKAMSSRVQENPQSYDSKEDLMEFKQSNGNDTSHTASEKKLRKINDVNYFTGNSWDNKTFSIVSKNITRNMPDAEHSSNEPGSEAVSKQTLENDLMNLLPESLQFDVNSVLLNSNGENGKSSSTSPLKENKTITKMAKTSQSKKVEESEKEVYFQDDDSQIGKLNHQNTTDKNGNELDIHINNLTDFQEDQTNKNNNHNDTDDRLALFQYDQKNTSDVQEIPGMYNDDSTNTDRYEYLDDDGDDEDRQDDEDEINKNAYETEPKGEKSIYTISYLVQLFFVLISYQA